MSSTPAFAAGARRPSPPAARDLVRRVAQRALQSLARREASAALAALLRSVAEGALESALTLELAQRARTDPAEPIVVLVAAAPGAIGHDAARDLGLTEREADVAALAAEGFSALNISASLGIAESTVRTHLKRTYAKLGVFSRVELARRLATAQRELVCVIQPAPDASPALRALPS